MFSNMDYYAQFEGSSQGSSVAQSRDPLPRHRGAAYREVKHMILKELQHDCDMQTYKKFHRDFLSWMTASFLGGQ